ncbi:hypothetical protein [Oceanirhabdus sp. W0125-5]|uniref:hypothetical protein n=1 Tax=Oceanirhabdus sp. W0125-5 TaxID=2999116 RepID=UPI0022F2C4D5|nr:hypothetical protein [Oceanirhabdus sp. W0125-5]WBW98113.1 hypothetical protein OW730_04935 [Oceanirhabdus sp. W0125-5]
MKKTSVGNIVFRWIFPIFSYLLFFISIYLIKLVDERMGLERDLYVRNKKLFASVLTPELVIVYKIILVIGALLSIYFIFKVNHKNKSTIFGNKSFSFKPYYYSLFSIVVSIATFAMLFFIKSADTLAFPWIVITLLIMAIVQYIRIIQYMLTK